MRSLNNMRKRDGTILALGTHRPIIQSILDFDYLCGKTTPSVRGIITGGRKTQKFFFGKQEVLVPCFESIGDAKEKMSFVSWMLNLHSGRRACKATSVFFNAYPESIGGHIFAEQVPEKDALVLVRQFGERHLILGPSGVGFLIPGVLKLGAIGGVCVDQLVTAKLATAGNIAVISTSGGMINECIRATIHAGRCISFAAAVGGDQFPITSLTDLFLLAQRDAQTDACVYFGELGGIDEYEITRLIEEGAYTKPIVAYIAGSIDDSLEEHIQFGHAKALVRAKDESAEAKREALRAAGVMVPDSFGEFLEALATLPQKKYTSAMPPTEPLMEREGSLFSTRTLIESETVPSNVRQGKLISKEHGAFITAAVEILFGRPAHSPITTAFIDEIFALSIDHGGHVSGAVNTMITARAGKDLVSSLAAGLLTIGPRFGGAVNEAASTWFDAVGTCTPQELVESKASAKKLLSGIGHKKYRVGLPDPRVETLSQFAKLLKKHHHYDFARAVEKITTAKNGSLILNLDGVIAALILDILIECEHFSKNDIRTKLDAEVCNALFIIPRTVGFIGHFIEQKNNDEGLFRLPDSLLLTTSTPRKKKRK